MLLTVRADAVARSPTDLLADATTICTKDAHIPAEGLPCLYYMAAVQNMTALCDERGEKFLGICRPPNSTVLILCGFFATRAYGRRRIERNARLSLCLDWTRRSLVELGPMFDAPSHGPALRPLGCKSDKANAVGACLDRACQLLSVPRLCDDFPLLEANRHRDPMRP